MSLQEYIRRREFLLEKMEPESSALIFSAPEVIRNADNKYHYRQNSDFWYFTGFNEPQALLILLKNKKNHHHSILFNRSHDKISEIWNGPCQGQEKALEKLGVSLAIPWNDLNSQLYLILNGLDIIYHAQGTYKFADKLVFDTLNKLRNSARQQLQAPTKLVDWRPLVHNMRLIKSKEEISIIRDACKITSLAHIRAMQHCRPGMYEYQLEGEIQYEFNRHGARFPSYSTIVGSGENSCILHYSKNASKMKSGNLVLVDAGCEYHGYASDVTRTFPVNGCFSTTQRIIYNLVLAMLNCAISMYKPGCSIQEVTEESVRIMVTGLVQLGIMKGEVNNLINNQDYRKFFMHDLSHWLGLDVHDVGSYGMPDRSRILEPGMVLTIEPGIYIANDADVPPIYRGIGIRIEDDILITDTGNENLTNSVFKKAEEIENLMISVCK